MGVDVMSVAKITENYFMGLSEIMEEMAGMVSLPNAIEGVVKSIEENEGIIYVSGVGKSRFVAEKFRATLASLGYSTGPFLHPTEAKHGDVASLTIYDILFIFSASGETKELVDLMEYLRKRIPVMFIFVVTTNRESRLARRASILLWTGPIKDPIIPSLSTTAMMAVGDAICICLMRRAGIDENKFCETHPGGGIGLRNLKASDVMRKEFATCVSMCSIREALQKITEAKGGAICVVNLDGVLKGIMTDGDVRRWIISYLEESNLVKGTHVVPNVGKPMSENPITISLGHSALDAYALMKEHKVDEIPVVDGGGKPVGMIDIQDLMRVGIE